MSLGIVRWFDPSRGFGIIDRHDSSGSVLVHISDMSASQLPTLTKDQVVSFETETRRGRKVAVGLTVIAALSPPETIEETGRVKWFDADKQYGFIIPDNGGKEVFVHMSAVERAGLKSLEKGAPIKFSPAHDGQRICATNLQFIE